MQTTIKEGQSVYDCIIHHSPLIPFPSSSSHLIRFQFLLVPLSSAFLASCSCFCFFFLSFSFALHCLFFCTLSFHCFITAVSSIAIYIAPLVDSALLRAVIRPLIPCSPLPFPSPRRFLSPTVPQPLSLSCARYPYLFMCRHAFIIIFTVSVDNKILIKIQRIEQHFNSIMIMSSTNN